MKEWLMVKLLIVLGNKFTRTKIETSTSEVFLKIEFLVHEAHLKIDEQTNLTAGMSPSGHLPGKMDSPASSSEIFRRMSANAKAPVRLPGCLRSGA